MHVNKEMYTWTVRGFPLCLPLPCRVSLIFTQCFFCLLSFSHCFLLVFCSTCCITAPGPTPLSARTTCTVRTCPSLFLAFCPLVLLISHLVAYRSLSLSLSFLQGATSCLRARWCSSFRFSCVASMLPRSWHSSESVRQSFTFHSTPVSPEFACFFHSFFVSPPGSFNATFVHSGWDMPLCPNPHIHFVVRTDMAVSSPASFPHSSSRLRFFPSSLFSAAPPKAAQEFWPAAAGQRDGHVRCVSRHVHR